MTKKISDFLHSFFHTLGVNGVLALFGIPFLIQLLVFAFAKSKISRFIVPIVICVFAFFFFVMIAGEGGFEAYSNRQIMIYLLECAMIPITMLLGALTGGLLGLVVGKVRKKNR